MKKFAFHKLFILSLLVPLIFGIFAFKNLIPYERTVSIAVDKMNILYAGIKNPLTIAVAGVMPSEVKVESKDLELLDTGNGLFQVSPYKAGKAFITVSGKEFATKTLEFIVKRVPDPIAVINHPTKSYNGEISAEEFKKSKGVSINFDPCFNYELDYEISEYALVWVRKKNDVIEAIVRQGDYTNNAQRLVDKAQPGDVYYFDNIKAKSRMVQDGSTEIKLNAMVFKIK